MCTHTKAVDSFWAGEEVRREKACSLRYIPDMEGIFTAFCKESIVCSSDL